MPTCETWQPEAEQWATWAGEQVFVLEVWKDTAFIVKESGSSLNVARSTLFPPKDTPNE